MEKSIVNEVVNAIEAVFLPSQSHDVLARRARRRAFGAHSCTGPSSIAKAAHKTVVEE